MNTDRNKVDTARALKAYVTEVNPRSQMVFAAHSATMLEWIHPDGSLHREPLITGRPREGRISQQRAMAKLVEVAGSAAVCVVTYTGKRSISWRTAHRCQSHICNGLPKSWDMPNYAQANGRATGDNKAVLRAATGRDHVVCLSHKEDHQADLATEEWVDVVAGRMRRGMMLSEAVDASRHPFPENCDFNVGRNARPAPRANRKTLDRRLLFERKDKLGYELVLEGHEGPSQPAPAPPPRPARLQEGTDQLAHLSLDEALTADVLADCEEGALQVTDISCIPLTGLGLAWSSERAKSEIQQSGSNAITTALSTICGRGHQMCYSRNITRLHHDVRTHCKQERFNYSWRLFDKGGVPNVAFIRYREEASSPATAARRIVWHAFTGIPTNEVKHTETRRGMVQTIEPKVDVLTRGPLSDDERNGNGKRPRTEATLQDMVKAGQLQPGEMCITTFYKGATHVADLTDEGQIRFDGELYASPTAFRSAAMQKVTGVKPTGVASGWQSVRYKGHTLQRRPL